MQANKLIRATLVLFLAACGSPHFDGQYTGQEMPAPDAAKWIHISPEEMEEPLESGTYEVGAYVEQPGCGVMYGPAGMDKWELWVQDGQRYLAQIGQPHVVGAVAIGEAGHPNTYVHRAYHYSGGCVFEHMTHIKLTKHFPFQFQGDWEQRVNVSDYEGSAGCSMVGAVCRYAMKVAGNGEP